MLVGPVWPQLKRLGLQGDLLDQVTIIKIVCDLKRIINIVILGELFGTFSNHVSSKSFFKKCFLFVSFQGKANLRFRCEKLRRRSLKT